MLNHRAPFSSSTEKEENWPSLRSCYGSSGMQFAFWFTFGGLGFWWFIDIFRVPGIVSDTNSTIAREIVQTLSTGSAFRPTPQNFELLADPEGV
jgi:hypothetical protein